MYRFFSSLCQPFPLLMLSLAVVAILFWRKPRAGRKRTLAFTILLLGLIVLCTPPVGRVAIWGLERGYPPLESVPEDVETLVVLSGSMRTFDETGAEVELTSDTMFRCLHAAELHQKHPRCRIVVTGGKADASDPGPSVALAMHDMLVQLGIESSDLTVESAATSTYENALYCRPILEDLGVKRIVLITDATHMYRATRCFQAQGFEVIPAACNHQVTRQRLTLTEFLPSPNAANRVAVAIHEWLGVIWYWLHGRI